MIAVYLQMQKHSLSMIGLDANDEEKTTVFVYNVANGAKNVTGGGTMILYILNSQFNCTKSQVEEAKFAMRKPLKTFAAAFLCYLIHPPALGHAFHLHQVELLQFCSTPQWYSKM